MPQPRAWRIMRQFCLFPARISCHASNPLTSPNHLARIPCAVEVLKSTKTLGSFSYQSMFMGMKRILRRGRHVLHKSIVASRLVQDP